MSDVIHRPTLRLRSTNGDTFDLRHRPGNELTAVFFGYTRCPDVCPTTMADLAAARRRLPPIDAERVRVVFITEDPKHDTALVLRSWLDRFDRSFIGLLGGNNETMTALDALKAPRTELTRPTASPSAHSNQPHTSGEGETVEHTGSVYVFRGDRVVVYTGGTTPSQYAEDFRLLLE